MLTGILLAAGAGGIWSLSGIANSTCARFRLNIVTYLLANVTISMILSGIFTVDFGKFFTRETLVAAAVMMPAGAINTSGALFLQKALQKGHHGIVFLISQSALVVPFIAGVTLFGEKAQPLRCTGAGMIFVGMVFCALPKLRKKNLDNDDNKGRSLSWILLSLASFACFGCAQSLMSLPSYWKDFSDPAGSRTMLMYGGCTILMCSFSLRPSIRRSMEFSKPLILCGGIVSVLNTFSMFLIFKSLDFLSTAGIASIGFSLAISSSLVLFTLYSIIVMKEKCYFFTVAGLVTILSGGVLLSGV